MKVYDFRFLARLFFALVKQLKSDDQRYGDTWLYRTRRGQEERIWKTINGYFKDYFERGVPIPWLKIIGNAFIALLREWYPEIWPE